MDKRTFFLIFLLSFCLMVFEFLLAKELMFVGSIILSRVVIPLLLIGFSAGSVFSSHKILEKDFYLKIIFFTWGSIVLTSALIRFFPMVKGNEMLIPTTLGSIPPFFVFGLFFGRVYSQIKNLGKVFLTNGIGLMLGAIASGLVYKYMGWSGGLFFVCSLLLSYSLIVERRFLWLSITFLLFTIFAFQHRFWEPEGIPNYTFQYFAPEGSIVKTENTTVVRTDLVKSKDRYVIFTDGRAPSYVFHYEEGNETFKEPIEKEDYISIPYVIGRYDKVLVIGSGGGIDLVMALRGGASEITGIELNPVSINIMRNELKDYSGSIYYHPKVRIINEEGRSFVENTDKMYDLIVLFGTDTCTSNSFITSTTLECYLYTTEAMRAYWRLLSNEGMLFICRSFPEWFQRHGEEEILKLYRNVKNAHLSQNIKNHVSLIRTEIKEEGAIAHSILLSKSPFTEEQYEKLISSPTHHILHWGNIVDRADDLWEEESRKININATTDDRPSHYEFEFWQEGALSIFAITLPIILVTFILTKSRGNIALNRTLLFLLLGIGYIAMEVTLVERMTLFLKNPAYSTQVVLSSFLLFGGFGGYFGASLKRKRLAEYSFTLAAFALVYVGIFNFLYRNYSLINWQWGRILFSFILVAPLGFFSAIPFSIGLSMEKRRHLFYAIDAVGTVIGSFFIYFIHKYIGFSSGLIFAGIVYFVVFLIVWKKR